MSQIIVMPEIHIGDLIEVKWNNQYKIYELNDVACWSKDHSIKTIEMQELTEKYWSYRWKSKKQFDEEQKKLRLKAKLIFKDGDKLLINCSHDSVPYTINIETFHDEFRLVHFKKMMTT